MSIVVSVPFLKPHRKHIPHLMEWYALNKAKHDLLLHWEPWKALHKVLGEAVSKARHVGATHILFTEDDQWGYPEDGLEKLLEQDVDAIGFPTYFKSFPYLPLCMRKRDPAITMIGKHKNLRPFSGAGIEKTDLITWAFTLVKTSVFERMEEAGLDPFKEWGEAPNDSYFSQYCEDLDIPRYIDFSFWINHGEEEWANLPILRRAWDSIYASRGMVGKTLEVETDHDVITYQTEPMQAIEAKAIQQEALAREAAGEVPIP